VDESKIRGLMEGRKITTLWQISRSLPKNGLQGTTAAGGTNLQLDGDRTPSIVFGVVTPMKRVKTDKKGAPFTLIHLCDRQGNEITAFILSDAHKRHYQCNSGDVYAVVDARSFVLSSAASSPATALSISQPSQMVRLGFCRGFSLCPYTGPQGGVPCGRVCFQRRTTTTTTSKHASGSSFCEMHYKAVHRKAMNASPLFSAPSAPAVQASQQRPGQSQRFGTSSSQPAPANPNVNWQIPSTPRLSQSKASSSSRSNVISHGSQLVQRAMSASASSSTIPTTANATVNAAARKGQVYQEAVKKWKEIQAKEQGQGRLSGEGSSRDSIFLSRDPLPSHRQAQSLSSSASASASVHAKHQERAKAKAKAKEMGKDQGKGIEAKGRVSGKDQLPPELQAVLQQKSRMDSGGLSLRDQLRLDKLEKKEEQSKEDAVTAVSNIRGWHCQQCQRYYWRRSDVSETCQSLNHVLQFRSNLVCRYFVCHGCGQRETVLQLLHPSGPCKKCGARDFAKTVKKVTDHDKEDSAFASKLLVAGTEYGFTVNAPVKKGGILVEEPQ
jgi:hypothetical protein